MYLKVHETPEGEVVALCDAELIGRVLADSKRRLDLSMFASFYRGERVGREDAVEALRPARNANLVGRKALAAALEAGIDTSGAVEIAGVPHLQVYRV